MVLIGPHGTPGRDDVANHSMVVRVQPLDEQRPQLVAVGGPVLVAREPGVVGELGHAEHLDQLRNWPLLPAVMIRSPSEQGSGS